MGFFIIQIFIKLLKNNKKGKPRQLDEQDANQLVQMEFRWKVTYKPIK